MDMHVVGKFADRIVPTRIGKKLHFLKNALQLGAVPRQHFDARNLLSHDKLQIEEVFIDERVEHDWKLAASRISVLHIPDQAGGVNPGDRKAIFHLVHHLKPRAVLEVGTHIGASTSHIASALHYSRVRHGVEAQFTTVDFIDVNCPEKQPWLAHGARNSPRELIAQLGFDSFVEFVAQKSLEYMANCDRRFDFIFLDGDHSAEAVYCEVSAALRLLNPGGVILLHDYFPDLQPLWSNGRVVMGPYLGVRRFLKEGARITVQPLGRLPWPTKCNSSQTSLALLLRSSR